MLWDYLVKSIVAVADTSDGLFKSPKVVKSIEDIKDKNPDIIDFKDIEDVDIKIIETTREEKQTIDGQQVSYDPKHYTYMIGFDVIIKVNHPYIKTIRISLKNGTVQIYNEGRRLKDDYVTGFIRDRFGITRVEERAVHYDNLTIQNIVSNAMKEMPEYSFGFKCTLKNYDSIKEYAYYLALCDDIKTTLLNK